MVRNFCQFCLMAFKSIVAVAVAIYQKSKIEITFSKEQ